MNDFYVYVYIDPRNLEEFYYGKGRGSRKDAHLFDESDSAKAKRIRAIRSEGLAPIVKVLVRGLSERDALLVEKTLLWKLGKLTTNVCTGHFADMFRPQNTLHRNLAGFDFERGIYYYNVGEGDSRSWDDYVRFGFISAGQGKRWKDAICGFREGDVFAAYLKGKGFVGVGRIDARAMMVRDALVEGRPILTLDLACHGMAQNSGDPNLSEYVCRVTWIATVPRDQAKWRGKPKLFTSTHVRASLAAQSGTIEFVNDGFRVDMNLLVT